MKSALFVFLGLVSGVLCGSTDWLVEKITTDVTLVNNGSSLILTNGLISREFTLIPDFGTVDFRSESKKKSILRTIAPEAYVTLDGTQYAIGGLVTSEKHDYLNRSALGLVVNPDAFYFVDFSTGTPEAPFHWEPGLRHSPSDVNWPPKGLTLRAKFIAPSTVKKPQHAYVTVYVNYEMYVGIPLLAKWVTVEYQEWIPITIDGVKVEYLSTQKPYSPLSYTPYPHPWDLGAGSTGSWLYVETNQPHGTQIKWTTDPLIVFSPGADEPLLECSYSLGPGVLLGRGSSKHGEKAAKLTEMMLTQFDSFRVLELVVDSYDRERLGLSRHRMSRVLTPQTQENPIFFHCTDPSADNFKLAINQMVEVGFEMFIYSFGSGFHLEDTSPTYIDMIAAQVQYAKQNGMECGGYDLICLDRGHGGYGGNVGDQWDVIVPGSLKLGQDACFASGWYDKLRGIMFNLINQTGLASVETDGPYGGTECAATNHSHHTDLNDSVYWQNRLQGQLYSDLKELNVFINQPDLYFYQGGNKAPMGYNENQYSLPRWEDISVSRQGMYDDTYHYIPTQAWMFVPLTVYHAGGSAAEFQGHPLEYEWALAQYLGYGVAACYRGPLLYNNTKSMQTVQKWVSFYKTYRDILISDIVHVRRPDMQDVDSILHVNPYLTNRGLAMVFNPTSMTISRDLTLPLYYTGITTKATLLHEGKEPGTVYALNREYEVSVPIRMSAKSITWYLVLSAD